MILGNCHLAWLTCYDSRVNTTDCVSELEVFLHSKRSEGDENSRGEFTLNQELALEKIANYQLPGNEYWILKLIQAASLLGVKSFDLKQTKTENALRIYGQNWPHQLFEGAFFSVESTGSGALDHLRMALWSVGISQRRAFQLTFPRSEKSYFWDGAQMTVKKSLNLPCLYLNVSHRIRESDKILSVLNPSRAARVNARVLELVRHRAFTAPITLRVDGRRHDGLQHCPSHGFQEFSYPMYCFGVEFAGPALSIPPGTFETPNRPRQMELARLCQNFDYGSLRSSHGAVAFLCTHCGKSESGERRGYRKQAQSSRVYWVRHGVVVQEDVIDLPEFSTSFGIFMNASHLDSDISGFALRESQTHPIKKKIFGELTALLEETRWNFSTSRVASGANGYLAGSVFATIVGALMLGAVNFVSIFSGLNPEQLLQSAEDDCAEFVTAWKRRFNSLEADDCSGC